MKIREFDVVVAYEDPLKKLGIKAMFEAPKDLQFNLYEDVSDLEELRKVIAISQPDIVVIDATFKSDSSGIELAAYTKRHSPRAKIVIMAISLDTVLIKVLKKLEIKWILYKAEDIELIKKCAGRLIENKPYISRIFREQWYQEKENLVLQLNDFLREKLSKTEISVVNQVALGKTNKEIANQLFKSEKTIKNHRYNICKKLELEGTNALFKYIVKL